MLSKADAASQKALKEYGYNLGMAFQLVDDCLDYTGSTEDLGKNIGDDLAEGKPTLPLIHAMQTSDKEHSSLIADCIRNQSNVNLDEQTLEQITQLIENSGAIDYTMAKARQFANAAKESTNLLVDSTYKSALIELAEFSLTRNH